MLPGALDGSSASASAAQAKTKSTEPVQVAPGVVQQTIGSRTYTSSAQVINADSGHSAKLAEVPDLPHYTPSDFSTRKSVVRAEGISNWSKAKTVNVTMVKDGDTLNGSFKGGSGQVVCRVTGIDAPETAKQWKGESGQKYGEYSKETLQKLVENKEVSVQISLDPGDKVGASMKDRSLCLVTIKGKNLSTSMVEAGAAYVYDQFVKPEMLGELKAAEGIAKEKGNGVWSNPGLERPWDYRRRMQAKHQAQ